MEKVTKSFVINEELGLHCRPSASFVKLASQFESKIIVEKNGETANGKSLLDLLMLAAGQGSKIAITAIGPDATLALDALGNLVKENFMVPDEEYSK
jgi:phosphocarrier protein